MPQRRDAREAIYEPPDRSLWPLALVRDEGGGEQPAPRDVRHLLFIKDSAQRDHAYLRLEGSIKPESPWLVPLQRRKMSGNEWKFVIHLFC